MTDDIIKEYKELYDEIENVNNSINEFCAKINMSFIVEDKYAKSLLELLQKMSSELSETAQELEEHLTNKQFKDRNYDR